jgi:hypothetical protein
VLLRKIRTPHGKYMSLTQYVALARRNGQTCIRGHVGCAAWAGGLCIIDLIKQLDPTAEETAI